jgi:MerR family mercuric resistance operon transcriptional regulator
MKKRSAADSFTIGQLSKLSDTGVEAIRFYERRGVLPPAKRTEGGYRQYGRDTVKRLHFIHRAQELGFSLKEITQLIALRVTSKSNCSEVKKRALSKLQQIESKISDLQKMRDVLKEVTQACVANRPIADCPILNSFDK